MLSDDRYCWVRVVPTVSWGRISIAYLAVFRLAVACTCNTILASTQLPCCTYGYTYVRKPAAWAAQSTGRSTVCVHTHVPVLPVRTGSYM